MPAASSICILRVERSARRQIDQIGDLCRRIELGNCGGALERRTEAAVTRIMVRDMGVNRFLD
jgi:hypothetical protein